MNKIGLFFGSDTGVTESIAKTIRSILGEDAVDLYDVYDIKGEEMLGYDKLILGLSTWHDGQLQSAWDDFYNRFKDLDLTGKTVAVFGLGDQYGYSTYYCDGVGVIARLAEKNGAKIIGHWPTSGYEHDDSKALIDDQTFIGLCLDEDNQADLTDTRVQEWTAQIKNEFGL
ncbi:MAG: flavodoxin [Flavobacteriales bacterium]|nr:flavodoxin [Flavobacteriales bacterium]